jgi:hypothetical protein
MEESTIPFPPVPWRLAGRAWIGLFRTDAPVSFPAGLRSLLGSRWLVLVLARYLEGTLRYDELVVGPPVWCGRRAGVWVTGIWVDLEASRRAGRCLWGLPKELAEFQWHQGGLRICDQDGLVAALTLDDGRFGKVPIWVPAVGIGRLEGQWACTTARVWAHTWTTRLRVDEWSVRFPFRPRTRPVLGLAVPSFRMTVPAPRLIRAAAGKEQ